MFWTRRLVYGAGTANGDDAAAVEGAMTRREPLTATLARWASIALAAGGVTCALAWGYFVYHYGWARDRQLASWIGVVEYYIAPAAAALLMFLALRLRPDQRINVVLVGLGLIVPLYVGEIALWMTQDPFVASEGSVMTVVRSSKERTKLAALLARRSGE